MGGSCQGPQGMHFGDDKPQTMPPVKGYFLGVSLLFLRPHLMFPDILWGGCFYLFVCLLFVYLLAQDDLKPLVLLLSFPKSLDYRHVSPYGFMLGEQSQGFRHGS